MLQILYLVVVMTVFAFMGAQCYLWIINKKYSPWFDIAFMSTAFGQCMLALVLEQKPTIVFVVCGILDIAVVIFYLGKMNIEKMKNRAELKSVTTEPGEGPTV